MDSRSVPVARPAGRWIFVSLEKATMGASNRLSADRGLSARFQVERHGIPVSLQTNTIIKPNVRIIND